MDHFHGNAGFELSTTERKRRSSGSPYRDVSEHTGHLVKERDRSPSKKSLKFLLTAPRLLLLCTLVLFCALGVLDFSKGVSAESHFCDSSKSLRDLCGSAMERMSAQLCNATAATEKLKSRLDQVQADYENAQRRIASFSERQYDALEVKYSKVHEVFSTCSECKNCGQCGDGWRRLGVKCYYFSTDFLNWTNSRDRCVEKGGHLIIITSQAEQNFVSAFIGSVENVYWIGLNDLQTEGKWMWVNNQPLNETGVIFWFKRSGQPDEPDNWKGEDPLGENCALLHDAGAGSGPAWYDVSCRTVTKYICEK